MHDAYKKPLILLLGMAIIGAMWAMVEIGESAHDRETERRLAILECENELWLEEAETKGLEAFGSFTYTCVAVEATDRFGDTETIVIPVQ